MLTLSTLYIFKIGDHPKVGGQAANGKLASFSCSNKEELLKPSFSNATVISNMGIMPSPTQTVVTNQQQDTELLKQKTLST